MARKKKVRKILQDLGLFLLGLIGVVAMTILGIIAQTLLERWLG